MLYSDIEQLIGDTPLLEIPERVHGLKHIRLFAKLEHLNPFGSVKDRIAKGMLAPVQDELVEKKKTILEASSGNTAKALAALGGTKGLAFKTVTNRIKSPEVRMLLQTLGADIEELPGLSDCPDPMDPNDFTTVAENMAKQNPDVYHYTDQYFNTLNLESHKTTGKEIWDDLEGKVDLYFGFLGTCGSSMGVGTYLKENNPNVGVYGVVADAGYHVPGGRNMNELWEVGFFKKEFFTEILSGTSPQAIEGLLVLNRECGILGGPTSGLTYYATVQKLKEIDAQLDNPAEKLNATFIVCDRIEPYMSYIQKYQPDIFSVNNTTRKTVHTLTEEELRAAQSITVDTLNEALNEAAVERPLIIDVRGHFAFSIGSVPGSINILDELFASMINEGPMFPKDTKLVIVCANETLSRRYASFLKTQGYDASFLEGGITAYRNQGHPLVK